MASPPNSTPRYAKRLGCVATLAVALTLALCATAAADLSFCPLGSASGQCGVQFTGHNGKDYTAKPPMRADCRR